MKKLFNSPIVLATMIVLCMASPILIDYAVYGKSQNGHLVMRYPSHTEVISNHSGGINYIRLIGKTDCNPEYKLVTVSTGRFAKTNRYPLSTADIREWNNALAIN